MPAAAPALCKSPDAPLTSPHNSHLFRAILVCHLPGAFSRPRVDTLLTLYVLDVLVVLVIDVLDDLLSRQQWHLRNQSKWLRVCARVFEP
jgi:hypothetical protein